MLKIDCTYFKGDRPCKFHKEDGIKCKECNHYKPIKDKILIIKLDAIGDVLRTTSILPPLRKKYPDAFITWCTKSNATQLFVNNDFVDEIITFEDDALFRISAEEYNIVINLDTSKISSSIAATARGKNKIGFVLNKKGYVEAASKVAEKWLEMSAFDDLKKKNKQTYQEIMYEMLELNKTKISKPILNLSDVDIKKGNALTKKWKLSKKRPTIGLNVGVGTKWPSKGWTAKRWEELIEILNSKNYNLLLLGGQDEKTLMARLCRKYKFLINTGYNNSLVEFAAIVNLCDIIITADTLALHIGTALNKKIIALFGPTSISEINLFGRGIKITAPDDCKCYYNKSCSEEVSCMEKITSGMIMNAVCEIEKL
ncbi:MAG: glycosyltransferase family 9 protein [Ignavibacteria bacterium]|nr:glycosyltransferase family 9 protein [Ignavibacteria bacterium]